MKELKRKFFYTIATNIILILVIEVLIEDNEFMEFHPERREEILAKRKRHNLVESHSKLLEVSIKSASPGSKTQSMARNNKDRKISWHFTI